MYVYLSLFGNYIAYFSAVVNNSVISLSKSPHRIIASTLARVNFETKVSKQKPYYQKALFNFLPSISTTEAAELCSSENVKLISQSKEVTLNNCEAIQTRRFSSDFDVSLTYQRVALVGALFPFEFSLNLKVLSNLILSINKELRIFNQSLVL